jgi:hypothetical protein
VLFEIVIMNLEVVLLNFKLNDLYLSIISKNAFLFLLVDSMIRKKTLFYFILTIVLTSVNVVSVLLTRLMRTIEARLELGSGFES